MHIVVDTEKLFPDYPRQFSYDVLSDLDFQLFNEVNYKFQYNFPRRQRSGLFKYHAQVEKFSSNQVFSGKNEAELQWDNKQKQAKGQGNFELCMRSSSFKTHLDIDTNLIEDKNDAELDLNLRFDFLPKKDSIKSFIASYDVKLKSPKHTLFQLIDLDGNLTKQSNKFETFNSLALRMNKELKEINMNAFIYQNLTGDNSTQTHISFSLPFKNLPYVIHDFKFERSPLNSRINHIESRLVAKPTLLHYAHLDFRPSTFEYLTGFSLSNEFEYLRSNGDILYADSRINVAPFSEMHSFGLLKRNTDLLHKHSIGYVNTEKTKKVSLSFVSPQISEKPLSIIGEFTLDRDNRIGKLRLPQEFGIYFEFGTPLSNLTAFRVYYNLPLLNENRSSTLDGTVALKFAAAVRIFRLLQTINFCIYFIEHYTDYILLSFRRFI